MCSLVIAHRMPLLKRSDNIMVVEISYTKRMFGFFKADEKLVDKVIRDYGEEIKEERRW